MKLSIAITHRLIQTRLPSLPSTFSLAKKTQHLTQQRRYLAKMGIKTDITLYTAATPNGIKIPIVLEELGLEYKVRTGKSERVGGGRK